MRSRPPPRRMGFSVVELLTVIAVISLLVALLLPAIQQAREAARRSQCQNNLRQLGLALSNYEGSFSCFPPRAVYNTIGKPAVKSTCWTALVLPFLEQPTLYNEFNFGLPWCAGNNERVSTNQIAVFQCPSAPAARWPMPDSLAFANRGLTLPPYSATGALPYGFCDYYGQEGISPGFLAVVPDYPLARAGNVIANNDGYLPGIFFHRGPRAQSTRIAAISDGLSQTMLLCEDAGRPALYYFGRLASQNLCDTEDIPVAHDGWGWADTEINGFTDGAICVGAVTVAINGMNDSEIYSFHAGGAQVSFGDGSVKFLNQNVGNAVLIAIISMNAGDVPGDF